jgi:hypothetical protein
MRKCIGWCKLNLVKQSLVQGRYGRPTDFSVLWRHSMNCVACVLCTVQVYTVYACTAHSTHATQVILCRHSTENVCTTSISTLNRVCNFS